MSCGSGGLKSCASSTCLLQATVGLPYGFAFGRSQSFSECRYALRRGTDSYEVIRVPCQASLFIPQRLDRGQDAHASHHRFRRRRTMTTVMAIATATAPKATNQPQMEVKNSTARTSAKTPARIRRQPTKNCL